jgi:hypothetical protein
VTPHNYLLFVFASILLVLVPGPDMAYMLARCIAQGRRAGILAALGFNLGGYVHLTAAVLGLSAILASSSVAFTVVKWLGAAYLVYLGISALRSQQGRPVVADSTFPSRGGKTIPRSESDLSLWLPAANASRCLRFQRVLRPVVFRITAAHVLADVRIRTPPEAREVARHLNGTLRW